MAKIVDAHHLSATATGTGNAVQATTAVAALPEAIATFPVT